MLEVWSRVAIKQVQELVEQNLVVVHAEAAADRGLAVTQQIPRKAETGRKVLVVAGKGLSGLDGGRGWIREKPQLAVDFRWNRREFVAEAQV